MRILTWSNSFWPGHGGLERMMTQLVAGLAQRGHEQLIVTQSLAEAERQHAPLKTEDPWQWSSFAGQPIHRIDAETRFAARDVRGIARLTAEIKALRRDFRADVVHATLCTSEGLIVLATDDDTPMLVSNHLVLPAHLLSGTSAYEHLIRRANVVVAVSESVRRDTVAVVPEVATRVRTILNGVPVTSEPPPLPERPTILGHGRLVAEKGFATLIVAFSLLLPRLPAARLVIAGDGYMRKGLEHLADHLGLLDRVTFTGWVDEAEVRRLIDASAVIAVPSAWNEPFGLSAAEASERARPVVASRIGGLPEVVADGETGILVQAGDPLSFAAAIETLLMDPELARTMGAAGRRLVHQRFTFERCIDDYEAALKDVSS